MTGEGSKGGWKSERKKGERREDKEGRKGKGEIDGW